MNWLSRLNLATKAFVQLGPPQLGFYGLYQLGLRTGHYRRALSASLKKLDDLSQGRDLKIHPCLPALPARKTMLELLGEQVRQVYEEAEEILNGCVRLFGGKAVPLRLALPAVPEYWTRYDNGRGLALDQDIKLIWEPGRFGWACKLAMAYHLSGDERYAEGFWRHTGQFLTSNLPYDGPHWSSAQEAAIRLVALAFSVQAFSQSIHSTPRRMASLAQSIAVHAERIPPTLAYARAQNNNHLISEALGLYTASATLPEHPLADRWHNLGRKWLIWAFRKQIATDGTYIQHSTNYHRMMLQAALWMIAVHDHCFHNETIPTDITGRLGAATGWLWAMVDPESGRVPNLGHNDGAYILPLSACPFHDYRPAVHAAARAFLHSKLDQTQPWDDMAEWLCLPEDLPIRQNHWTSVTKEDDASPRQPYALKNQHNRSWGTLRVANFRSRPAHADQLHLDLWWRGHNFAQDAGTYLYNSAPPWDNSLTSSLVHNTVTVDGQECMWRKSRFLYLDWAQGKLTSFQAASGNLPQSLTAEHNGYRKIGITHSRTVSIQPDGGWEVIDRLHGASSQPHRLRLHWLLPDWEYEVLGPGQENAIYLYTIRVCSPGGWISLKIGLLHQPATISQPLFQLVRAGKVLFGTGEALPIAGWTSPTYGDKIPALAVIYEVTQVLPAEMNSQWTLPSES